MTVNIILIALALAAVWLIFTFNSLIALRNQVRNAFRQIDVQLKRRYDLIPNLVNSVKGEMKFEQETLEKVIQARSSAMSVSGGGNVGEIARKEGELSMALGKLIALSENYPNLKADQTMMRLQEELTTTENKISFARQYYNDEVNRLNTAVQSFPGNVMAGMFGFKVAEFFQVETPEERNVPQVKF